MENKNKYEWLDGIFECVRKGKVTVIGGRPGMGKTALSLNIAIDALNHGEKVAICVMSADKSDILCRLYSIISGVEYHKILNEDTNEKETADLSAAWNTVGKWQSEGLLTIIPDYFYKSSVGYDIIKKSIGGVLILADDMNRYIREDFELSEHLQCRKMCSELKEYAKDTETAVILTANVSREVEKSSSPPYPKHLKYYKAIRKYIERAVIIYRKAYYDKNAGNLPRFVSLCQQ